MNFSTDLHEHEGNIASLLHQSAATLEDLPELASIASALSRDKATVNKANAARQELQTSHAIAREYFAIDPKTQSDLLPNAPGTYLESARSKPQSLASEIPAQLERAISAASLAKRDLEHVIEEHDYIKMLLGSGGKGTLEQMDVLAFPKTRTAKSNVLTISGEAGTGKTLCLLAKLIRDVDASQGSLTNEFQKTALFVCFNTPLASSIISLLSQCAESFPFAKKRIEVWSFDKLVNSLVKANGAFGSYANDVRFDKTESKRIHYETVKKDSDFKFTREAMSNVAKRRPKERKEYYLNYSSTADAEWMSEEIRWLQSRYRCSDNAQEYLSGCERTGRGGKHQPRPDKRNAIVEVWREYESILDRENLYTIEEAIHRLLSSQSLPKFDSIAVDECQDLSVSSVQLLLSMRRSSSTFMYIAGDENQKIYSRDFNWKSLDGITARTSKTLHKNQRNPESIVRFANRLLGTVAPRPDNELAVQVGSWPDSALLRIIEKSNAAKETIAIIGSLSLHQKAQACGLCATRIGILAAKGLEFDNVIVEFRELSPATTEEEMRLRYVHFTRAKKRLYVRYHEPVPRLLAQLYSDYL